MTIPALLFLASPLLFPSLSPLAVWIGLGSVSVAVWLLWKADDFGHGRPANGWR